MGGKIRRPSSAKNMAVISSLITWFLTHDKKRIRFLSAFLVGATWPISFPVALLFSLF
ncbi:GhoT/OrtT family toxin [Salmonella enterica subsp. enterica serovar Typhimurium]|nr:GhoT/OrtT family toxin [Salmonella enterica subsp. enterica serovar Typhimurium]